MRKILISTILLGFLALVTTPAFSALYTFTPDPIDIYDLDHYAAYTWGIDWTHTDTKITDAYLTFKNIRDWIPEPDDILYTHLLDNADLGVSVLPDYQGAGDYFDGQGILVDTWSDPDDGTFPADLTFSFRELGLMDDLNAFISDGRIAFAFDPDCHYFNDGVELSLVTAVPEPSTFLLLGLGALGLAAYRRKH